GDPAVLKKCKLNREAGSFVLSLPRRGVLHARIGPLLMDHLSHLAEVSAEPRVRRIERDWPPVGLGGGLRRAALERRNEHRQDRDKGREESSAPGVVHARFTLTRSCAAHVRSSMLDGLDASPRALAARRRVWPTDYL